MNTQIRPTLSTALVLFFSMVLLFLGLFAEVFESHTPEVDLAQIYANPVPVAEIQHIKSLRIANKQGSFVLENTHPDGNLSGPWQMISPQSLKVKDHVVERIVDALNIIRVRNFHRLEPININSFSLDNPTLTLNFTTLKNKSYEIKMGLINPIDNSSYMSLSSQDQIYQIDPIEMALESYDLAQLVESKILALNNDSLASMEIYSQEGLEVKILKKEEQWVDQNGVTLSNAKVKRLFDRLEGVTSFSILENLTTEQKDFMIQMMATPVYSLKLVSAQGVRNYVIGEVKGRIPDTNLGKKNFYAVSSEERQSFVLIESDQLKVFNVRPRDLK